MAADDPSGRGDPGPAGGGPASMTVGFDTSVAHPARIWDLVPPGLVQLHRWRPGPAGPDPAHDLANYGAVARKP